MKSGGKIKKEINSVNNFQKDCLVSNHFKEISRHKISNMKFQILEKCNYEETAYQRKTEHFFYQFT